jgi:hypothetical protein
MAILEKKVRTCLWFHASGVKAAEFYVSLLPDSRIDGIMEHGNLADPMVDDADAAAAKAAAAGAEIVMPVADQFWGDRYGLVKDPFGHMWSIATPIWPPKSPEEMEAARGAAMQQMSGS